MTSDPMLVATPLVCESMGDTSDRDLYLGACSGDRAAFQTLAERHHSYTLRLSATLVGGDSATAEDVAHKSWLNVCRHIKKVTDGERPPLELQYEASFMAWLKTVTTNVANDEFRRQSRASGREIQEDDMMYVPDLDERLVFDERQSAVWSAFRHLNERCQELMLLLIEDPPLDYQAISVMLDRPIGSIGPTRARCIEQLRSKLQGV